LIDQWSSFPTGRVFGWGPYLHHPRPVRATGEPLSLCGRLFMRCFLFRLLQFASSTLCNIRPGFCIGYCSHYGSWGIGGWRWRIAPALFVSSPLTLLCCPRSYLAKYRKDNGFLRWPAWIGGSPVALNLAQLWRDRAGSHFSNTRRVHRALTIPRLGRRARSARSSPWARWKRGLVLLVQCCPYVCALRIEFGLSRAALWQACEIALPLCACPF